MELSVEALGERIRQKVNILFERGDLDGSARNALLDTLSPPAPEPDEATKIWREMRARGLEVGESTLWAARVRAGKPIEVCEKMFCAELSYLRQAIAELIASKDGEIERLAGINSQLVAEHNAMNQDGARLESELATLRAENERLKALSDGLRTYMYDKDASRREWVVKKYKAAERNTAEPLVSLASGEPKIGGWTSDAKYAPNEPAKTHVWPATHDDACSEIEATEMTPDVVVTQADCQREQWARNIASYTEGQARNHVYECAINLLTEAEARGRREALEEIKKWLRSPEGKGSDAGIDYADGFADQIERMMTGGK